MNEAAGATPWVGYVIAAFLALITALLGLVSWFAKGAWEEQRVQNKEFRDSFNTVWDEMKTKVSDIMCKEREAVHFCNLSSLEKDFRRHSHSTLPNDSGLLLKE